MNGLRSWPIFDLEAAFSPGCSRHTQLPLLPNIGSQPPAVPPPEERPAGVSLLRLGTARRRREVADILGNTAEVVRRHYGRGTRGERGKNDRGWLSHVKTASV